MARSGTSASPFKYKSRDVEIRHLSFFPPNFNKHTQLFRVDGRSRSDVRPIILETDVVRYVFINLNVVNVYAIVF